MKKSAQASLPQVLLGLLEDRNIIVGEDAATYDLLRDELVQRYQPQGILQWMDIKHLQDAIWEIFRLNRMKSAVVNCDRKTALKSLLKSMLDDGLPNFDAALFDKAARQAAAYFTDPEAKTKIEADMANYNLDANAIAAKAFVMNMDALEAIDRQIQAATARAFLIRHHLETGDDGALRSVPSRRRQQRLSDHGRQTG